MEVPWRYDTDKKENRRSLPLTQYPLSHLAKGSGSMLSFSSKKGVGQGIYGSLSGKMTGNTTSDSYPDRSSKSNIGGYSAGRQQGTMSSQAGIMPSGSLPGMSNLYPDRSSNVNIGSYSASRSQGINESNPVQSGSFPLMSGRHPDSGSTIASIGSYSAGRQQGMDISNQAGMMPSGSLPGMVQSGSLPRMSNRYPERSSNLNFGSYSAGHPQGTDISNSVAMVQSGSLPVMSGRYPDSGSTNANIGSYSAGRQQGMDIGNQTGMMSSSSLPRVMQSDSLPGMSNRYPDRSSNVNIGGYPSGHQQGTDISTPVGMMQGGSLYGMRSPGQKMLKSQEAFRVGSTMEMGLGQGMGVMTQPTKSVRVSQQKSSNSMRQSNSNIYVDERGKIRRSRFEPPKPQRGSDNRVNNQSKLGLDYNTPNSGKMPTDLRFTEKSFIGENKQFDQQMDIQAMNRGIADPVEMEILMARQSIQNRLNEGTDFNNTSFGGDRNPSPNSSALANTLNRPQFESDSSVKNLQRFQNAVDIRSVKAYQDELLEIRTKKQSRDALQKTGKERDFQRAGQWSGHQNIRQESARQQPLVQVTANLLEEKIAKVVSNLIPKITDKQSQLGTREPQWHQTGLDRKRTHSAEGIRHDKHVGRGEAAVRSHNEGRKPDTVDTRMVSKVVYMRNLPLNTTANEVVMLGLPFGKVTHLLLMKEMNQALLEFRDGDSASNMVSFCKSTPLMLRLKTIVVQYSTHKEITKDNPDVITLDPREPQQHRTGLDRNRHTAAKDDDDDDERKSTDDQDENQCSKVVLIRRLPKAVVERSQPQEIVGLGLPFGRITNMKFSKNKFMALLEFSNEHAATKMVNHFKSTPAMIRSKEVIVQYSSHQELDKHNPSKYVERLYKILPRTKDETSHDSPGDHDEATRRCNYCSRKYTETTWSAHKMTLDHLQALQQHQTGTGLDRKRKHSAEGSSNRSNDTGDVAENIGGKRKKTDEQQQKVLLLRNLPSYTTEKEIAQLSLPFGKIVNMVVVQEKYMAFVEFSNGLAANRMYDYFQKTPALIRQREVNVVHSTRKRELDGEPSKFIKNLYKNQPRTKDEASGRKEVSARKNVSKPENSAEKFCNYCCRNYSERHWNVHKMTPEHLAWLSYSEKTSMMKKAGQKMYFCKFCESDFKNKDVYVNHFNEHIPGTEGFVKLGSVHSDYFCRLCFDFFPEHERETHRQSPVHEARLEILKSSTVSRQPAEGPEGVEYISPIEGFICKLCHSVHTDEGFAFNDHCKILKHVRKVMESRIETLSQDDVIDFIKELSEKQGVVYDEDQVSQMLSKVLEEDQQLGNEADPSTIIVGNLQGRSQSRFRYLFSAIGVEVAALRKRPTSYYGEADLANTEDIEMVLKKLDGYKFDGGILTASLGLPGDGVKEEEKSPTELKEESATIFIRNLSKSTIKERLGQILKKIGVDFKHIKRTYTYAWVDLSNPEDMQEALKKLDGYNIDGSEIGASVHKTKVEVESEKSPEISVQEPLTIIIGNLKKGTTGGRLYDLFDEIGVEVRDIRKKADMDFGEVDLIDDDEMEDVLHKLDGYKFDDSVLTASLGVPNVEEEAEKSPQSEAEEQVTVAIGNLKDGTTGRRLIDLFEEIGVDVNNVRKKTGSSFGQADLANPDDLKEVLDMLDGYEFDGSILTASLGAPDSEENDEKSIKESERNSDEEMLGEHNEEVHKEDDGDCILIESDNE